jgi:hypothetical protein
MKWDRLLSPIKEPFTNHISNQQQTQLALSIFKLVRNSFFFVFSGRLYRFNYLDFTFCKYIRT